ncbi:hypothetical protein FDZ71_01270 [bacterium]|nr:MAG: hypothetical protein FDZ71_01270 [bacterium]
MADSTGTPVTPDGEHLAPSEAPSLSDLARSVRGLRTWLIVLTVLTALPLMLTAALYVADLVGAALWWIPPFGTISERYDGVDAVRRGPALESVGSLPVDESGAGTFQGAPTGAATSTDDLGTFELVLHPAPAGLPPRTTLEVTFDHSTKVYRGGRDVGDPLDAMNGGAFDADPSAAGTVKVAFHIKDGTVLADRLDLSDDYPPGVGP